MNFFSQVGNYIFYEIYNYLGKLKDFYDSILDAKI